MLNFAKWPIVLIAVILNGYVPLVSGDSSINRQLVASLEEMLPSLVSSEDYRTASNVAFQLASAHKRLGESPAACAALSQSLELYRKAVVKESGQPEADDTGEVATLYNDDSNGMGEVRAKFGCDPRA
jgi:hypothetical protein